MLGEDPVQIGGRELERAIERRIDQRTWGAVHRLRTEVCAGRVIVHGCTSSYYSKQLALQAIREFLDSTPIELDISVIRGAERP